jgi:hypothetical protein
MGTMMEPNAMGVSTFGAVMQDEYIKAIRAGQTIDQAKRTAFGAAAAQAQLYNKIATNLDVNDGKEMSDYINGVASVPGLEDLMFNNPHYSRWLTTNRERQARLQQEVIQGTEIIKSLTQRDGGEPKEE